MGRKCSVENCLSDSNRPQDQGVTFHKIPHHSDLRPKWLSLCRIPEDKKILHVCSRHFLRADFCNFKGKKYMLRQGVLPSVFPWDKSKLEALKAEASSKKDGDSIEPNNVSIKKEASAATDVEKKVENIKSTPSLLSTVVKTEIKTETPDEPQHIEPAVAANTSPLTFTLNSRIEVLDNNNIWYTAKIIEVDNEESEILIHFEKFSNKYDEWISMNSSRLRPLQPVEQYSVGEKCLAAWSDSRKFPATVTKVLETDTYEVLFDDGYVKTLKAHRMIKAAGQNIQVSPLFDPVKGTKQERRDKKRKINVAALFRKKPRLLNLNTPQKSRPSTSSAGSNTPNEEVVMSPTHESLASDGTSNSEIVQWHPLWLNGKPVGTESSIEAQDGIRKSIIVSDPRIPPGWVKHLVQRSSGISAGKWDTVIVGPENRRFRARSEIKQYLLHHPEMALDYRIFDFSIYRNRAVPGRKSGNKGQKRAKDVVKKNSEQHVSDKTDEILPPVALKEEVHIKDEEIEDSPPGLKIIFEDDAYKCPIEGCGKNFRRENLALMHVKHYHPEYTKYLDSTPNVADLAYARTVGENLERSPGPPKSFSVKSVERMSTPKTSKFTQSPLVGTPESLTSPQPHLEKTKDTEIIKLLSQKPFDKIEEDIQPLPSGLPSDMYPDIKLKDLLTNTDDMPKREEMNLKTLCATRPPVGIKTLLPVVRPPVVPTEPPVEEIKPSAKRKRGVTELIEVIKAGSKDTSSSSPIPPPLPTQQSQSPVVSTEPSSPPSPSVSKLESQLHPQTLFDSVIIEGGKVIKLERMKQEEIINCTCGFTEEDGLMIQCELCLCWQHAYCNNIQRECDVPDKYVCYICQHPMRERSSMKYKHDQDWLKQGVLPTASFHSKDDEMLQKRFEKLKKCHDVSGGLLELREYLNTLAYKFKIAEDKNHPKLYLWSKPWEKPMLPEKSDVKSEKDRTLTPKLEIDDHQYIKNEVDIEKHEHEPQNDTMLMMILKAGKEDKLDLNSLMQNNLSQMAPIIPQPEAAINSDDCRLNLLEHIAHSESLVEERLDDFEKQLDALEEGLNLEHELDYPKTRQTLQMLMRDLGTLKEFSEVPTL